MRERFRNPVGDDAIALFDAIEHFLGAADDPDRLAAPFDHLHFAGGERTDVRFDRRAHGLGTLRGQHGRGKWQRSGNAARTTCSRSYDDQPAPTGIHFRRIAHGGKSSSEKGISGMGAIIPDATGIYQI